MPKVSHRITLTKPSTKTLDPEKLASQVRQIRLKCVSKKLIRQGWTAGIAGNKWQPDKASSKDKERTYKAQLVITHESKRQRSQDLIDSEYEDIVKAVNEEARRQQWEVLSTRDVKGTLKPEVYSDLEIPSDWLKSFSHIYERESQIHLILSSVHAGLKSNWDYRFHRVLVGPPASGKTESLRALAAMVGPDAALLYDTTQTSSAGAIRDLTERDTIPRLIFFEEIEKADENHLKWLLGVLDARAEINKTNFRGSTRRTVKSLVMATVNDWQLFRNMLSGALASRFGAPILFPAPTEKVLRMILEREVAKTKGGKAKWVDKTMEYVHKRCITDPRIVLQICLCGRDDLLTGKYQKMLDECDATNFLTAKQKLNKVVIEDAAPSANGAHRPLRITQR